MKSTPQISSGSNLDRLSWEILNTLADDCENLEQIYRGICYEMLPIPGATHPHQYDYRPVPDAPLLWEVVEHLRDLRDRGWVVPAMDEDGNPWEEPDDPSALWRAWFEMTPSGRTVWQNADDPAS